MEEKTIEEKDFAVLRKSPAGLKEVIDIYERGRKRRRKKRRAQKGARKSGYFLAILFNVVLVYLLSRWPEWKVHFLTSRFGLCLPILNFSLGVNIFGNFLLLLYDEERFKSFVYLFLDFFDLISLYILYKIFPFELPMLSGLDTGFWVRIVLLVGMIIIGVAGIIELFKIIFNTFDWR